MSALKVLQRRWLVILLGLLLTLGAAGYLYLSTPPRYQATARMLLLLPADSRGAEAIGSPFLYLPNGLNVLARIVAVSPTSREFRSQLISGGLVSQYEVGVDTASPTLTVSVEGSDPANVVATRDGLIKAMQDELLTIQREENAPRQQTAHTRVYAAEDVPERISGDRMRGILAAGAAGGLLTLLAAFVVDRLARTRRERRGIEARRSRKRTPRPPETPDDSGTAGAAPGDAPLSLASRVEDAAYAGDEADATPESTVPQPLSVDDEPPVTPTGMATEPGDDAPAEPATPEVPVEVAAIPRRVTNKEPAGADAGEASHEPSDVHR